MAGRYPRGMEGKLNYNQFRKSHKGKKQKEISDLWKIYKASPENEVKRDSKEQKMLNKLNVKPARTYALRGFVY